jgi:hypothetical protein
VTPLNLYAGRDPLLTEFGPRWLVTCSCGWEVEGPTDSGSGQQLTLT